MLRTEKERNQDFTFGRQKIFSLLHSVQDQLWDSPYLLCIGYRGFLPKAAGA
jgi:hypothetical protein